MKDHFSGHAAAYARHRPQYPPILFAYLATLVPTHELAWDCGTGNGQAAFALAAYFKRVVATDGSAAQLAHAPQHPRIEYRAEPAEQCSLLPASADLVTVAQALHWFDIPAFYREARRALRPGGVLAAWCYDGFRLTPALDALLDAHYHAVVGPWWPPERALVIDGYRTLPFPFEALSAPEIGLEQQWTLEDVLGYLGSASATQRFRQARGFDPLAALREKMTPAWGNPRRARPVRWTLHFRIGRK